MVPRDLPEPSPLSAGSIALVPVGDADLELLYQVAVRAPASWPRLTAAGPPHAPRFAHLLWRDVLAQYLVVNTTGVPVGLVAAHGADFVGRIAWFEWVDFSYGTNVVPPEDDAGLAASVLLVDYVLRTWGFHKLYRWETEGQPSPLAGPDVGDLEATFPADLLIDGRYFDRHIVGIHRHEWSKCRDQLLDAIGAPVVNLEPKAAKT